MKLEFVHADGTVLGTIQDTPDGRLVYGGSNPKEVERLAYSICRPEVPEDHPKGAAGFVRWLWKQLPGNGYGYAAYEIPDTKNDA